MSKLDRVNLRRAQVRDASGIIHSKAVQEIENEYSDIISNSKKSSHINLIEEEKESKSESQVGELSNKCWKQNVFKRRVDKANHKQDLFDNSHICSVNSNNPLLVVLDRIATSLEKICQNMDKIQNATAIIPHTVSNHFEEKVNYSRSQSDFIEHEIEDPELIRNPYPYESFVEKELSKLHPASRKLYEETLKLAKGHHSLAYYLYENKNLTEKTKKSFWHLYFEYMKRFSTFNLFDLKAMYVEKDITNEETISTLKRKWKQWKRLCTTTFGIQPKDFPKIKFSSVKIGKEGDHAAFPKEVIEETCKRLYASGQIRSAIMVHLLFSLALRPGEVKFLKFEDINMENGIPTIKVYRAKTNRTQSFSISQELLAELNEYKEYLISKNLFIESTRKSNKNLPFTGHFLFQGGKNAVYKEFSSKLNSNLRNNKAIRPKDLRISAISNVNTYGSLTQAATLANHRDTRITREHYTRAAIAFEGKRKTKKTKI